MKQKQVVFDFDGTIADSFWLTMRNFSQVLEKVGFGGVSDEVLEELRGLRIEERMAKFGVLPAEMEKVAGVNKKEMLKKFFKVKPFEGVKEVVEKLAESGLGVGMITSNLRQSVDIFIKKYDFDLFDYIYCSNGLFDKKEVIERLLKEKSILKAEMIYVGDEVRDVGGAKGAGVATIAVSWGYDSRGILKASEPDYLLDKPGEIIGAVGEIFS